MNSATNVGNAVKISTPTLSWERVGSNVNEGPGKLESLIGHKAVSLSSRRRESNTEFYPIAAIYHNGRTWIVYSASGCEGTGYKLGRLELTGSNPLSASSWTKFGNPVFSSANG